MTQHFVGALMKLTRIISICVIMGSVAVGTLNAQSFDGQPAEFPPASYKGKQYVDSKGCVFIRAGIDNNVTWVPRVSRERKAICGFKPTNVGSAADTFAATPAPKPAPAPAAAAPTAVVPKPAPKTVAAVPVPRPVAKPATAKPATTKTVSAQPVPKPQPKVVRQTAPKPAPKPARVAVAKPVTTAPVPTQQRIAVACPERTGVSRRYTVINNSKLPVRCGPQAAPIVAIRVVNMPVATQASARQPAANQTQIQTTTATRAVATSPATTPVLVSQPQITATTRIVPKHVAINRQNTQGLKVPKGYEAAWDDGRLNPRRAEQNLAGRRDMLLIWTQTTPSRLVNQATGEDMTAKVPLIYPYLDVPTQRRELGEVTIMQRDGKTMKRVVRNPGVPPLSQQAVYSTRSASARAATPVTRGATISDSAQVHGQRFVQVGVFANSGNAQRTAQQLSRMGMPARIGKYRSQGKSYLSVQAGPFNDDGATRTALGQIRGIGFSDAYPRN